MEAPQSFETSDARGRASIRCVTTCSILRSQGTVDVLAPAWGVRRLRTPFPKVVGLSLVHSLSILQLPAGGFDLSTDLATALGLRSPTIIMERASEDAAANQLSGALLVLKTAATYFSDYWDKPLQHICNKAVAFCCQRLRISKQKLWACLHNVERPHADLRPLPALSIAMLCANFGTRVLWSQCDLWISLLSAAANHVLQTTGGVMCPRNFLVELATVLRCPHEYHATYFLYRHTGKLFVGTVAEDSFCIDAMRQGRHLEAAVVSFGWLEEDRIIMETTLPNGLLVCYAGAPDALSDEANSQPAPLEAGDEAGYAAAGYELNQVFAAVNGGEIRIWKAPQAPAVSTDYIEVKKTTHLQGQAGRYKQAKFWMQAVLAACGGVLVAMTADSDDGQTATTFARCTLDELEANIPNPSEMWSDLAHHLQTILEATAETEGQWTLHLDKRRHGPVALHVEHGWNVHEHLHDTDHIAQAIDMLEEAGPDPDHCERGTWEMESGRRWSIWKPDGLDFFGFPGEVHHFKIAGHDYRVIFGPEEGVGVQENLLTGRQRKLRRIPAAKRTDTEDTALAKTIEDLAKTIEDDIVEQICNMGFSRLDVTRCLHEVRGDATRAVEKLLSSM